MRNQSAKPTGSSEAVTATLLPVGEPGTGFATVVLDPAAHTMHVDVVSVETQIYSGEAEFVVLPGVLGELGIYPRHAALFTQIKPGEVRIKVPGQAEEQIVFVQGGYLEIQPDVVTVLSDTAIRAKDLDEAIGIAAEYGHLRRGARVVLDTE